MFSGCVPRNGPYQLKEHLNEIVDLFGPFPKALLLKGDPGIVRRGWQDQGCSAIGTAGGWLRTLSRLAWMTRQERVCVVFVRHHEARPSGASFHGRSSQTFLVGRDEIVAPKPAAAWNAKEAGMGPETTTIYMKKTALSLLSHHHLISPSSKCHLHAATLPSRLMYRRMLSRPGSHGLHSTYATGQQPSQAARLALKSTRPSSRVLSFCQTMA